MDIYNVYLVVSLFVFLAWGIAWSKEGVNMFFKLSFFGMAIFAFIVAWQVHIKEQLKYIEHEKAKIELMKEAVEERK